MVHAARPPPGIKGAACRVYPAGGGSYKERGLRLPAQGVLLLQQHVQHPADGHQGLRGAAAQLVGDLRLNNGFRPDKGGVQQKIIQASPGIPWSGPSLHG